MAEHPMDNRREFANSANGDRWLLARDEATGAAYVVHEGNRSSGGAVTRIEIGKFLSPPHHSQHQAVLELIGTLADDDAGSPQTGLR